MPKPVILCIDDELMIREILRRQIRHEVGRAYQTQIAEDGKAALAMAREFKAADYSIALIICDYLMPRLKGDQVLKQLHELFPESVKIMLTGESDIEGINEAIRGANLYRYLVKPWDPKDLSLTIKSALQVYTFNQEIYKKNRDLEKLNQTQEKLIQDLQTKDQLLSQAQLQVFQADKMSSLGQMLAGVTHEINNPVNFLAGSIHCLDGYLYELAALLQLYEKHSPDVHPAVEQLKAEIKPELVIKDSKELLSAMQTTTNLLSNIGHSMRQLAHQDDREQVACKLSDSVNVALMILTYRLKANSQRPEIRVHHELAEIPEVMAYPSQLNQVMLNLLVNAIDALEEGGVGKSYTEIETCPQQIWITYQHLDSRDRVFITVRDNAGGIPEEIQELVFQEFFTTKSASKGTGLGLPISQQIIERNHGGTIRFNTESGVGTTFTVELPIHPISEQAS